MWPFPLKNWKKCWNHFYKAFPKEYPVILIIFLKSEQKKWNCLHCTSPTLQNLFIPFLSFLARIRIRIFLRIWIRKFMRIRTGQKHADPDPKPWPNPSHFLYIFHAGIFEMISALKMMWNVIPHPTLHITSCLGCESFLSKLARICTAKLNKRMKRQLVKANLLQLLYKRLTIFTYSFIDRLQIKHARKRIDTAVEPGLFHGYLHFAQQFCRFTRQF